jgi:hypothetical protein
MYKLILANESIDFVTVPYSKFEAALWRGRYCQKTYDDKWRIVRATDNAVIAQSVNRRAKPGHEKTHNHGEA